VAHTIFVKITVTETGSYQRMKNTAAAILWWRQTAETNAYV